MEILHFKNLEPISTTSWGSVYRAHDPLLERTVALKIIHPQGSSTHHSELLSEARAAAALDHPNICTIHQVHSQEDGTLVMVLSWCPGGSLNDLLSNGPLTGKPAFEMACGVISGLMAIHASGLLHRDIKPGNILVDGRGQPKLADFGIATALGDSHTTVMTMSGTLPYMAPELFQGQKPSVASDLWALGAVLFQMVSGQPPFTDTYEAALRYSIEYSDAPVIELETIQAQRIMETALRCLDKSPDQRPESAAMVLDFLLEDPQQSKPDHQADRTRKWPVWMAGTAVLVLLFALVSGPLSHLFSSKEKKDFPPSGVTILPFTSVGGDDSDEALAIGLSQQATDAMLKLEPEIKPWWFVPTKRIRLRKIDTLTRAHGLTGATYAITGRLEKRGDDLFQLSLRKEQVGSGIQIDEQEFVAELTASRNDLIAWQTEIPRRIVQLLNASWPENAEAALRAGSTFKPEAFMFFLQGQGYLANMVQPDTTAARLAFVQSVQVDPNYALGWWGLGLTDEERGGPGAREQARQKWHHSISLAPELEQPLTAMAYSFHYSEDDSTARHYLGLLMKAHPENFKGQLALGEVFAALGDSSAAHQALNQAISLHPGDAVGPNCLGAFLFNYHGNTEEAAMAFNQAASEASHDPDTLLFLGACHFANDQLNKSQRAFERSLSLERNALALEYLAIIYFYQGSYNRGAALAEELLLQNDSRFEVWNLLGVCQEQIPEQAHLARESYEKAAELCRAEILHADDRPSLWAMMGLIEAELGNRSQAKLWLEKTSAREPLSGDTMISLAEGYETLGDRETALLWLDKLFATGYSSVAVERHPGFADLRSDSRYRELQ